MKDAAGIVQIWTISPLGGEPSQLTHNSHDVASAFTWSPDGHWIAHLMDNSVCITDAETGTTHRLSPRSTHLRLRGRKRVSLHRTENQIAYVRPVTSAGQTWNQIFVLRRER